MTLLFLEKILPSHTDKFPSLFYPCGERAHQQGI